MDFMQEAANEALLAMGNCSPNPPVGAIIVSKDNKIIGRGHTQRFRHNHAEIEAINSCNEDLKESTLFTTLEPCNLTLNTPPCTDQIIKSKSRSMAGYSVPAKGLFLTQIDYPDSIYIDYGKG